MKRILFILVGLGFVTQHTILAQATEVIRIKAGTGGEKAVPMAARYRYEQFRDGKVVYVNGVMSAARFNYNVLLGEMQFIDSRGDTLALTEEPRVRMVGVGTDVFLYDPQKGYLEIIADYSTVKLVAKRGLKMARNERMGGYEQSSGSSAITRYDFYSSENASMNKLDGRGDLVVIKGKDYFIIDRNNRSYPMNKANVLKAFSKHREEVTAFLTSESVDFHQENDLKKLLKYCSELQ
ncbi:hypothetical protein GCM10028803_35550 [Larkinella knui]|uniref:Uncharacterized protein n=1 Tax=Larkinella knui TaxID=2025310 RepID=A0A3P1CDP9_9BACT|nr:hypothetical protein [Larkinella knui]RRB11427.1 hypothetical protein EHT87_23365 [Larkinella knui]